MTDNYFETEAKLMLLLILGPTLVSTFVGILFLSYLNLSESCRANGDLKTDKTAADHAFSSGRPGPASDVENLGLRVAP